MRIVLQRVKRSRVLVDGAIAGAIGSGLTLLVGMAPEDGDSEITWLVDKCLNLRLFPDGDGKPWQWSVQDVGGEILVVSQFTLYGDARKGRRVSFSGAAPPAIARERYQQFVDQLRHRCDLKVETGIFGAMMTVDIENDGPVTLILERP